jgi:hypothetical protein
LSGEDFTKVLVVGLHSFEQLHIEERLIRKDLEGTCHDFMDVVSKFEPGGSGENLERLQLW